MRATCFIIALCAATTLAAPTRIRRDDRTDALSQVEENLPDLPAPNRSRRSLTSKAPAPSSKAVNVLDEVLVHVEQILGSALPAESKVQAILDTIVHDIEGSGVEKREEEDPLETALKDVEDIIDGDESPQDKVTDILDGLLSVVEQRDTLDPPSGLDLAVLDTLDLSGLLQDLEYLVSALEQEVIATLASIDPSLAQTVKKLLNEVNSIVSEVEGELSLTTRDLAGLDLSAIDSLDVSGLLHDIETIVSKVEKAVVKELKGVDPALARTVRKVLRKVNKVAAEVEGALGL